MHTPTHVPPRRPQDYCLSLREYKRFGFLRWVNSTSSAFAWDSHTIVTCAHSVQDAKRPEDVRIDGLAAYPVAILRPQNWKRWGSADVAVLIFDKPHGLPVARRDTKLAEDRSVFAAYSKPCRFGKIRSTQKVCTGRKWRTFTASVVPIAGHSGGPLFSAKGVIGIAIEATTTMARGRGTPLGVYIPITDIEAAIDNLKNESPR